jgi:hypothetical protein
VPETKKRVEIPKISEEICTILQAKPDRALILLYDLTDTKLLMSIIVDVTPAGECIRVIAPCLWRSLGWAEIKADQPLLACNYCGYDKEGGWFFRQKQIIHFICAGCLQGN